MLGASNSEKNWTLFYSFTKNGEIMGISRVETDPKKSKMS